MSLASRPTDVAIIGGGVIGLSTALELARAGATCCVVAANHAGAASAAAAGLLAPAIGRLSPAVRPFFTGSLSLYDEFLASLRELDPGLSVLRGLIEVVGETHEPRDESSPRLSAADVARLEPSLFAPSGGFLHPDDGAIDNVRLVQALRRAVAMHSGITFHAESPADAVQVTDSQVVVSRADGSCIQASLVVIAAGAWSPAIRGLPRPLPVSPLKGQMLALDATDLEHPVMGDDVYLVPREREIVVGATAEHAGFDVATTEPAIAGLAAAAAALCPSLASARILRTWAGIRPATPDMLPIVGRDPDEARILYACGHSKNGILLAPATAKAVAALVQERIPEWDLEPFSISRFAAL